MQTLYWNKCHIVKLVTLKFTINIAILTYTYSVQDDSWKKGELVKDAW